MFFFLPSFSYGLKENLPKLLKLLDDNRIGKTSLLDRLSHVAKKLGRETHQLQLIVPGTPWSRCVNESTNITDCVLVIEMRYHACSICQPKLNWGWWQRFIHDEACRRAWTAIDISGSSSWLVCCLRWSATTKSSSYTLKWKTWLLWLLQDAK